MKCISTLIKSAVLTLAFVSQASLAAAVVFDDFETDLSNWTGKSGGSTSGILVADPFNPNNQVLSFTQTTGAGDIFTIATASTSGLFTVEFDYLGLAKPGSVAGDMGGYFGISQAYAGNHYWVAGTGSYPTPIALIDDNTWHHYELTFASPYGATPVHFMLEDYNGSGGVAGDIYFDNLVFGDQEDVQIHNESQVPEPTTLALFSFVLLGFGFHRRKAKKAQKCRHPLN